MRKAVKVVFSITAEGDLEEIGDTIAADNPRRAITFVRELRQVTVRLGELPDAFPLVPRYEQYGIRRRVFGNYLIFYRVEVDRVEVLRVLHGARDFESLLFPSPSALPSFWSCN